VSFAKISGGRLTREALLMLLLTVSACGSAILLAGFALYSPRLVASPESWLRILSDMSITSALFGGIPLFVATALWVGFSLAALSLKRLFPKLVHVLIAFLAAVLAAPFNHGLADIWIRIMTDGARTEGYYFALLAVDLYGVLFVIAFPFLALAYCDRAQIWGFGGLFALSSSIRPSGDL
jgi:hypothetical protein